LELISNITLFARFSCICYGTVQYPYRKQGQLWEVIANGSKSPQIDSEIAELRADLKDLIELGGDEVDPTYEWTAKGIKLLEEPQRNSMRM
jgi:hypothetical protein